MPLPDFFFIPHKKVIILYVVMVNKKIRQAVIPAAGLGSRFLPVTKCIPKELIPLVNKPCLQHVVDEAVAAGVEEFIFVISEGKKQIEEYFRPNEHLSSWLKKRGQDDIYDLIARIETQAKYRFVYQKEPLGLGHAVLCAQELVTDDHFFVILPDDIIASEVPVCKQMNSVFVEHSIPLMAVMLVNWEEVHRYGIVQGAPLTDTVGDIQNIVEKPRREDAPSNLAVIGRYILPKTVFPLLQKTLPGAGGEIQLTDALRVLITNGGIRSFSFSGERYDTGTPAGWIQANISLALKDPLVRDATRNFVKFIASTS